MLRFIVKRKIVDRSSGLDVTDYQTIDAETAELEKVLTNGGVGEDGCDVPELVGVEVLGNIGNES